MQLSAERLAQVLRARAPQKATEVFHGLGVRQFGSAPKQVSDFTHEILNWLIHWLTFSGVSSLGWEWEEEEEEDAVMMRGCLWAASV